MGVKGKIEVEVDIKSCGDLFHELFSQNVHHLTNITPHKLHTLDVLEGEIGKPGTIFTCDYTIDGKKFVAKEMVEEINEEKKYVRFKVIGGDLLNEFKSITISVQVIPMGPVTGVKWAAEFEKIADDGPYPTGIIDYCIGITRDVESHHTNA